MKAQAKKKSFPYVTVALIAVAVLVVFMLVYTLLGNFGVFGRLTTAAQTTNYKITENEMKVYEYQTAQNSLYQQWLYSYYGMTSGGMDATTFKAMYPTSDIYINAYMPYYVSMDAFDGSAAETAGNYLLYREMADSADFAYEDVDKEVDAYINSLKEAAETNNRSFNAYLSDFIGKGINESDVRGAVELMFIANEYAEQEKDKISAGLTDKELEEYRETNKSTFYSTKYSSYKMVDEAMKKIFEAKNIKTVEELQVALAEYYVDLKFDALYDTHVLSNTAAKDDSTNNNTKTGEGETDDTTESTDTDKDAAKAECKSKVLETILALNKVGENEEKYTSKDTKEYKIVTTINADVSKQLTSITKNGSAAYQDLSNSTTAASASELNKWLFSTTAQVKTGDTKIITQTSSSSSSSSSSGSTTSTTTYTWYLVGDVMVFDTEKTKEAYYALLKDDADTVTDKKTAEQKANALLAELEANLSKSEAELIAQLKEEDYYKLPYEAGTITDKTLAKYAVHGNFNLLAALASGASIGTEYYYEDVKDARDPDAPASTDALYELLFSDKAVAGYLGTVKATEEKDGETTTVGYYVVYCVGENEETWKKTARDTVTGQKINDLLNKAKETYSLEINTEPETTVTAAAA